MDAVGKMGMVAFSSSPVLGTPLGSQQCSWRAPLGHNGRDPLPWFVSTASRPRALLPPLVDVPLPWSVYPERCWVHTPNYSLPVSHLYPYLFCAQQNSRIKKHISNFSSPVRNIAYRNMGATGSSFFFALIKVIVTKLFKEHFQSKKKKNKPTPRWWEV